MWGLNPFKDWYKISAYSKWYHYFWLMPIIAIILLYVICDNKVNDITNKTR